LVGPEHQPFHVLVKLPHQPERYVRGRNLDPLRGAAESEFDWCG
jgi:hypothetical protein